MTAEDLAGTGSRRVVTRRDPVPVPRRALVRALRPAGRISVGAVLVVLAVGVVAPQVWAAWAWVPFVAGLVVGVPHGAVDHLVPWWTARDRCPPWLMPALLAGYVGLGAAAFVVARVWPAPALLGFLLVSIVHFGGGETVGAVLRGDRTRRTSSWAPAEVVAVLAHGAVPVVVPLALWPQDVRPVVLALAPDAGWLLRPDVLTAALVVVGVLCAATLVRLAVLRRWRDAGELLLVGALFVVVPPLAAFGVWFGLWHGLRHLMRMVATDPANVADLARGALARPLARFARAAALPTAAVLAVLVALRTVPGLLDAVLPGVVAIGLALVFALTVPHLVVVAVLDARQLRADDDVAPDGPGRRDTGPRAGG